jgi:hypothetical protein
LRTGVEKQNLPVALEPYHHKDVGIAFPTVLEGLPEEAVPSASLFLANRLEAVGVACADGLLLRGHYI